ncbi:MAG: hypothetical protein ACKO4T_10695, partial [Planctomycetaceae bacterium]
MAAWIGRQWPVGGVVAACMAVAGATALAAPTIESLPLAAAYGSGVHSYFAGDYQRAYDELSQAIEGGTIDPRAWYYRGLTALKLGRTDEAEADFSAGASREAEGTGGWPVAKSLERVQGCDRLKLERHRTRARVAQIQEDRRRGQLRYLDVERAGPDVLRARRPIIDRRIDAANQQRHSPPPRLSGRLQTPAARPAARTCFPTRWPRAPSGRPPARRRFRVARPAARRGHPAARWCWGRTDPRRPVPARHRAPA